MYALPAMHHSVPIANPVNSDEFLNQKRLHTFKEVLVEVQGKCKKQCLDFKYIHPVIDKDMRAIPTDLINRQSILYILKERKLLKYIHVVNHILSHYELLNFVNLDPKVEEAVVAIAEILLPVFASLRLNFHYHILVQHILEYLEYEEQANALILQFNFKGTLRAMYDENWHIVMETLDPKTSSQLVDIRDRLWEPKAQEPDLLQQSANLHKPVETVEPVPPDEPVKSKRTKNLTKKVL